jgi:hypothetical protein
VVVDSEEAQPITVKKRVYFSTHHIETAAIFARHAKAIEVDRAGTIDFSPDHWGYVVGSILSSVAYLEAAVNELFADASERHLQRLQGLDHDTIARMAEMWRDNILRISRCNILEKYILALRLARKEAMEKGKEPWQSTQLLILLRNEFVHYEPEWIPLNPTQEEKDSARRLVKGLRDRQLLTNPLTGAGNADFPDKVLGHGCAAWAVKSSTAFTEEFTRRLGIKSPHQDMRDKLLTE